MQSQGVYLGRPITEGEAETGYTNIIHLPNWHESDLNGQVMLGKKSLAEG